MSSRLVYASVAVSVILRIAFVFLRPQWQAPDEYPHFYYVHYWEENGTAPDFQTESPYYESFQPPLYYVLSSYILKVTHTIFGNVRENGDVIGTFRAPYPDLFAIRFFSMLLGILSLMISRKILSENFPDRAGLCNAAFILLLFHPAFLSNTTSVTNDALAVLAGAILIGCFLKKLHLKMPELTGLLLSASVFSKSSLSIFIPFTFLLVVISDESWKSKTVVLARIGLSCILCYGILYVMTSSHQTSLVPPISVHAEHVTLLRTYQVVRNFYWCFWVAFGRTYEIHLPALLYIVVLMPFSLTAGYGILKQLKNYFAIDRNIDTFIQYLILVALYVFASLSFSLFFSFTEQSNTSWGKNIFPILPAVYVLFVIGMNSLMKQRAQVIFFSLAAFCFIVDCWALFRFTAM